jgi:hypothetical protein
VLKKCNHLKDALELWKREKSEYRELRTAWLYRYSSIQILYETKKGRVVKCYLCGKIWYTQAEYSKHLSMQR